MKSFSALYLLAILFAVCFATPVSALDSERRILHDNIPAGAARSHFIQRLAATNRLNLVIALPLRNPEGLTNLLKQLYDPASPGFHQWLTPEQFSEQFSPAEDDYNKVVRFAATYGLKVTRTHSNRLLVDVTGPVTNIENAFQIKLQVYQHPTENRTFYAPDTAPSIATNLPILCVSGLDNYTLPHRIGAPLRPVSLTTTNSSRIVAYATGSSPGGFFMGNDYRNAYVPGVTNTGAGQYIAIVDVGGPYYPLDVYMYQTNAGLSTNIVVTNIIATATAYWTNALTGSSTDEGEEVLDIDMAMSMAPGATILNYEGGADDVFNQIAVDNKAKQITLSYGFGIDAGIVQSFQQFAAQGQSFSQASGDGGADLDGGTGLTGNPYATIVGGASLTTTTAGGSWQSDVVWGGSGGGISGYGLPDWQQGIATSANQGSATYRNYPDVSMPAVNIFTVYKNGTIVGATGGTSAASPLWAGFMALVNQQAAASGKAPAGFLNPSIYELGKGSPSTYAACFHDITSGNTFNNHNPLRYVAGPGYDLCSGWGTPTGINTINFLAGIGTNDFIFYPSQGTFSIVAGGSANATITTTLINGLSGGATYSITNLPAGVTANISPAGANVSATLSITTLTNTTLGTYTAILTGSSGSLTHSMPLTFVIGAPIPGAAPVILSSYYNRTGFYSDGLTFSTGFDGSYSALSANLLGKTLSWEGLVFNLGPSNAPDVVYCASQIIGLPAGSFNTLQILASAVQGAQTAQTFTVTYTDSSTAVFTQSCSDWATPQSFPGESTVFTMPYRNLDNGSSQSLNVSVNGYTFILDQTKTVKSITLPNNPDLVLVSMMLAKNQVSAPLTTYYNRAGIYTDGTTFTNPATGGIDGGGAAYSGTLLGGSQIWTNTLFSFGPVNATNVISAANQNVSLPVGNYTILRMLASGVQGNQVSQTFTVTYSDNTTTVFTQSMSDWYSPQNYTGETTAIPMGHRDSSDGSLDDRTFYLYGYSFALNSAKTLESIRLPGNANVIVTAISLIPNWQPTFSLTVFTLNAANAGQPYAGTIATNVSDLNGGTLTLAKVSGPAWLNISTGGTLSGTPLSPDVGNDSFVVSVTDSGGLSNNATMNIPVIAAPPVTSSLSLQAGNLQLNWAGGIAPYQVQSSTNLVNPNWQSLGTVSGNSLSITPTNSVMFYRIVGQ